MSDFDDLPWDKIREVLSQSNYQTHIPDKSTLEFVLKEENYSQLVESALKSLQKENPTASEDQARELADLMKAFAQKVLENE